jgi:beta-glucosidase/6-phospho-beta-glucosidase/beta-galactosidase
VYAISSNTFWDVYRPAGGILIGEFGFPSLGESSKTLAEARFDIERSLYFWAWLSEMLLTIYEDNVRVIGTLAWNCMDVNELSQYTSRYGMQVVNFTTYERTYKSSFF